MKLEHASALVVSVVAALAVASVSCGRDRPPTLERAKNPNAVLPRGVTHSAPSDAAIRTIEVAGKERDYLLVTPKELAPSPWLILVFHGDGGSAKSFHAALPYELASGSRALIAYPNGKMATWDLDTLDGNEDDLFVSTLISSLQASLGIDKTHVFAAGYSSGGFFINMFACRHPGILRGIASSAAGAPYNQKERWPNGYPGCPGQKATATIAMHGSQDFGVDVKSGRFTARYWSYVNGCDMYKQETTAYDECHAYQGCPAQSPVVYCEIGGLGHWVWDRADEASFSFFSTLDKH